MAITLTVHNGSVCSLAHNRRERRLIEKENEKWMEKHPGEIRIDLNREHELWHDENLEDVYKKLFDESVKKYNEKQIKNGHPERVINDYRQDIRAKEGKSKNAKHEIYEVIYSVGSMQKPVDEKIAKEILREIYDGFSERNPNMHVVCCAYHADEAGSVHIHLSYIPVAYNCKRGMKVQNSLSAALKEQGIVGESNSQTAQIMFEKQERDNLEAVVNRYGYEVEHPMAGKKVEHLTVEEYKVQKQLEEKQAKLEEVVNLPMSKVIVNKGRFEQLEKIEKEYYEKLSKLQKAEREVFAAREYFNAYQKSIKKLKEDIELFEQKVNEAANIKIKELKQFAIRFIKEKGLWQSFEKWNNEIKNSIRIRMRR